MTTPPILEVRDLTATVIRRGVEQVVLHGVGFSVPAGASLGIVGESGAGKSMLIRCILGVHPPGVSMRVTGHIRLDGHDMLALRGAAHRRVLARSVGMIHQDPLRSLNPTIRVGEQLTEVLAFTGEAKRGERTRRGRELMLGIGFQNPADEARRFPHELSGGQRQRIGIGAAAVTEPALLIGDEPTTALDVSVQARVLNLLADLRDETGLSILFISHDLAVVRMIADTIAVLRDGRIVETGDTESVISAPQHDYTRQLLDAAPHLPALPGEPKENR